MGGKLLPLPGEVLRGCSVSWMITSQHNRGRNVAVLFKEINQLMNGWINYYGISEMKGFMNELNGWLKRRIRQYIWKQWKNPRTRRKNLIALGIEKQKAFEWSNTRRGFWKISKSHVLHRSLTDKELVSRGYTDISLKYQFIHLNYWTAVYGSVRTVVWEGCEPKRSDLYSIYRNT